MAVGPRSRDPEQGRRSNLSLVLSIIHQVGPIPRSELTRRTGLNRSTISTIIMRLVALGLVAETSTVATAVPGRPSPTVRVTDRVVGIAVNPEVDAVTVGAVSLGGRVLARRRILTPPECSPEEMVEIAARAVRIVQTTLVDDQVVSGIGVAVPGLTDMEAGVVRYAPHLGWIDAPIADMLGEATGLPVVVANDATVGVGAEHLYGAGQGASEIVYLNAGPSGIGGGIVSGGVLRAGAGGFAGEFGHLVVRSDGRPCHCGSRGCLQTEISQIRVSTMLGLRDIALDELESALLVVRTPAVLDELRRQAAALPDAVAVINRLFNPERIVLGGYLAVLARWARTAGVRGGSEPIYRDEWLGGAVDVVTAALGSDILIIGAAELTFAPIWGDPTVVLTVLRDSAAPQVSRSTLGAD